MYYRLIENQRVYCKLSRHGSVPLSIETRVKGIHEILTAARPPWQNAYVERFIGTVRRECLDHLIIFNEYSLKRI